MPDLGSPHEDWFDDRLTAMESVFGKSDGAVSHAPVPFRFGFDLGGRADVVHFREYVAGVVYATCELMGDNQIANCLGAYELAICHRADEPWGTELISRLAYYTLDVRLEPGHTMDIGSFAQEGSTISALMFEEFARFTFHGQRAGVLLCIGITADEVAACRRGQRERVQRMLKSKGVYPFTDLHRRSTLRWF